VSPARNVVRIAVLGTGAIAQVSHLPILGRMRGVEVVALHDADHTRAQTIASRFGVPTVYRSRDEIWSDPEIDAVVVCTPSHLHEEHVREGLDAGKYVFCEKPLALTPEGSGRLLELEGAASRLMVGMNQRFRPDAGALKSFIAGGELGEIYYLRAGWLNRRVGRSRTWRQRKTGAGGGALMDLGVQMLDLSLWLMDYPQPERVTAQVHRPTGGEVEDSAVLLVNLADDRVINLEVTWNLIAERERQYVHLLGNAGSGSLSPLAIYKELEGGLANVTPQLSPSRENLYTASYRQEISHFVEAVRGERELEAPREHITLMRIVQAAYRSAEQGEEVRF
jgi:predicted dehydrogenase